MRRKQVLIPAIDDETGKERFKPYKEGTGRIFTFFASTGYIAYSYHVMPIPSFPS
jgi:hypothetical protein